MQVKDHEIWHGLFITRQRMSATFLLFVLPKDCFMKRPLVAPYPARHDVASTDQVADKINGDSSSAATTASSSASSAVVGTSTAASST